MICFKSRWHPSDHSLNGPLSICVPYQPEPGIKMKMSWKMFCFSLLCWEANSYYPSRGPIMGNNNSFKHRDGWDRGFSVPWEYKPDHYCPLSPLYPGYFTNISLLKWDSRLILITPVANNGKGEFFQPRKWTRQRVFSAWGIQTGQFAAL